MIMHKHIRMKGIAVDAFHIDKLKFNYVIYVFMKMMVITMALKYQFIS